MLRSLKLFVTLWLLYLVAAYLIVAVAKGANGGWTSASNLDDYASLLGGFLFMSGFGAFITASQFTGVPSDEAYVPPNNLNGPGPAGLYVNPSTGLPMVNEGLDVGGNSFGIGPDH